MMPTKKKTEKPKAAETVAVVEEKKQTEADKLLNEAHLLVDSCAVDISIVENKETNEDQRDVIVIELREKLKKFAASIMGLFTPFQHETQN